MRPKSKMCIPPSFCLNGYRFNISRTKYRYDIFELEWNRYEYMDIERENMFEEACHPQLYLYHVQYSEMPSTGLHRSTAATHPPAMHPIKWFILRSCVFAYGVLYYYVRVYVYNMWYLASVPVDQISVYINMSLVVMNVIILRTYPLTDGRCIF